MRDDPLRSPRLNQVWDDGIFVGATRPVARVTIQRVTLKDYPTRARMYRSVIVGQPSPQVELPNVKSIEIQRQADQDVASCTVVFYNTKPLPVGQIPTAGDIDQRGYYTFSRGTGPNPWSYPANEWTDFIVPDRFLRTFQGYGINEAAAPYDDLNLLQTGVWLIDDVDFSTDGIITVTCRDIGGILLDQHVFPPVLIPEQYPLIFQPYADLSTHPRTQTPTLSTVPGNYRDYCADEATEILTRRGWLRWNEVEVGDEALAMDPETGVSTWQVIESVYRQHRQREMISLESESHSSLTTPDHRWLVTDQKGRRSWRTTETLRTGHRIPLSSAVDASASVSKYDDAFVELGAWFWTEGSYSDRDNACISQSDVANPDHVESIRACLSAGYGAPGRMLRGRGAMWNETRRADGVITFRLSKPIKDVLLAVMPDKVPTPDFLVSLTRAQLDMFIERSLDADGWRTTHNRVGLSQRDERRIKAFEMACALAGKPTRTRLNSTNMWTMTLLRHRVTLPQSAVQTRVQYEGVVWCPTLRHHNWLARRNGTVYITGNTDIVKQLVSIGGFFWPPGPYASITPGSPPPPASSDSALTAAAVDIVSSSLSGDVAFALDSAVLTSAGRSSIGSVMADTYGSAPTITVVGHASSEGTEAYNQDLSERRAASVKAHMLSLKPGSKISSSGRGESQPIADNGTEAGRSANRRVEITYTRMTTTPAPAEGRAYGDFEVSGTYAIAGIPLGVFDKKPIMDGITYVKEILGFVFFVDERGGCIFRSPNIFRPGNYLNDEAIPGRTYTTEVLTIDETRHLKNYGVKLSNRNKRSHITVGTVDGKTRSEVRGYEPIPTDDVNGRPLGLIRHAIWTDQHFANPTECTVMAEMIALRLKQSYRVGRPVIAANPNLQPDDQVLLFERVTNEHYRHYVSGYTSSYDAESGAYDMTLDTYWLGEASAASYVSPGDLSDETSALLVSRNGVPAPEPTMTVAAEGSTENEDNTSTTIEGPT